MAVRSVRSASISVAAPQTTSTRLLNFLNARNTLEEVHV
jgi:hypothetical protein